MDRWQFADRWTFTLALQGVRAERNVRNTDVDSGILSNPSEVYTSINPRIGAIFDLSDDASLYANVSRLYEPPTNYQLQDNVAGGDATLDAMYGTVLEVGTRGGGGLGDDDIWQWDLSLYYAEIHDEILSVDDPSAPGTSLSTNVDQTVPAGLELLINASWDIGKGSIEPLLSLTVNHFEFDNDPAYGNNRLPVAPKYALHGEVMYSNDRGWFAGPTFDLTGERYGDFTNTFEIEDYALLGLRGGWSGREWKIFAELGNLLDEEYVAYNAVRDVATSDAAILYPGAPRSAFVGIEWKF
jgi:iron complex outermembrane receptor protein